MRRWQEPKTPVTSDAAARKMYVNSRGEPNLSGQVKLWPTPTAQDYKRRGPNSRQQGLPEHFLCHGELNQHHLLMGPGYTAVIEFNRMHLGVQTADLYHFIRKALEKHGWNLRLGMKMLDSYDRVLPMGKKEREYLYYLFLYPEKYWKQLNFYHNANKAWIPARNVEKLRNLEAQQKEREAFLKQIRS